MQSPNTNASNAPVSKRRKRIVVGAKLAVTIALFAWLLSRVEWAKVGEAFRQCNLWLVAVAVVLCFVSLLISAYKWEVLLNLHGVRYRFMQLVRWYFIGMFLNKFLPTTIGGDGYRIYKTIRNPKAKSCAVLAVLVERASGFAALLLLGLISATILYLAGSDRLLGIVVAIGLGSIVLGAVVLYVLIRIDFLQKVASLKFCPRALVSLLSFAGDFRRRPSVGFLVLIISVIFQLISITIGWLTLAALGAEVDFLTVAVVWTAVEVVGLVPISLGGLGLVDAAFVQFMGHFDVAPALGLSAMLLRRASTLPMLLAGGICYLAETGNVDSQPIPDEAAIQD